jgi:hypothetical protein
MPDFRKWILALSCAALATGIASAQVGANPGATGSSGGAFSCGVTNGAVTPTLRAEGYTEEVGDIVLICSGGTPLPTNNGAPIPTANITVFLNTTVTSRLLSNSNTASEALLLIDEPGSALAGYGPTVPQILCSQSNVGAGPGGCVEYVGTSTVEGTGTSLVGGVPVTGTVPSGTACTTTSPCSAGANVFQGITTGNQVVFNGIPVMAPATAGATRVYRITNIRANANQITAGGATPGAVTASLSINSATSIAITNSTLTVGFVQQGLSATGTLVRNSGNTGSSSGASLAQCSSLSITSTSSAASGIGTLQFMENFATAFKVRASANNQNVPGQIYNAESGFFGPALPTNAISATGFTEQAGLADYGTRLKATFNNVPSGISVYVTTRDVTNAFVVGNATGYTAAQAVEVISETAPDTGTFVTTPTTGVPLASQTTTLGLVSSVPLSPVAINPATGTGIAVWEIVNTNPNQIDTVDFGVYFNYTANAAANSPTPGSITVTLSYAPTPSGGAFTSTTGAAASSTLTIPRFSDSLDVTKTLAAVNLCTTPMLFPYVINVNGFDTGIAIANTTTDPFGTAAQAGICNLYFYGSSAPTTNPFPTPVIPTATVYANLASFVAPGFSGYMIANCNFQFAHGFAFISDVGARNLAMGYLALILPSTSRSATEALNN